MRTAKEIEAVSIAKKKDREVVSTAKEMKLVGTAKKESRERSKKCLRS